MRKPAFECPGEVGSSYFTLQNRPTTAVDFEAKRTIYSPPASGRGWGWASDRPARHERRKPTLVVGVGGPSPMDYELAPPRHAHPRPHRACLLHNPPFRRRSKTGVMRKEQIDGCQVRGVRAP